MGGTGQKCSEVCEYRGLVCEPVAPASEAVKTVFADAG